ncbi:MAG: hypothetical protein F4X09_05940 [Gammaproteobacteria bacterium]|nr:hypothetical protein [Gammaproteobacteria bacterium]MYC59721.1 hypothetical protein [Gammaproteobacteria bacterium]MYE28562.1 hypothetical protein [Gammaproteobacteria bacterium]MYI01199.1 hypothetical protein [Gammaproteobacteria bacterium]
MAVTRSRWIRIAVIVAAVYVLLVVAFESMLGYFQPTGGDSIVIVTTDDVGNSHERVISRRDIDGNLYVAANHWPRQWYGHAIERPQVGVASEIGGAAQPYLAVPLAGDELERVAEIYDAGLVFKFMTGFPPRRFLRLDPL